MTTPDVPDATVTPRAADPHADCLGDLVTALTALDYGRDLVVSVLGPVGWREALQGSPGAALRRLAASAPGRDTVLTGCFFLRDATPVDDLRALLGEDLLDRLLAADVLVPAGCGSLVSTVDIRPVDVSRHDGRGLLVVSDPDASLDVRVPGPDHVPGVGHAPLTLLNQVPPDRAGRLLDLGTGSGVLALTLAADEVVATDIHGRALDFARASERSVLRDSGDRRPVDWREGSWFDPVAGELFDRIVSNPPFVVGTDGVGHVYRDSGLELDGASRLVTAGAAEHLSPGGTAHLLGAWATGFTESPASRVASWLPETGIRAWVVQRDEVDPETYVRTWLTDESVDLRTAAGRERTRRWLEVFAGHGVTRIGMGYLHLQRIDGPTEVTFEEITHPDLGFFGDEVAEWFLRAGWLSGKDADDVLDARYAVRPTVARESVELPDPAGVGFRGAVLRLTRTDGPRFSHEVDTPLSAVVAGLDPRGLGLRDTAGLYCAVNDLDEESFTTALVPLVVDLVRHGLLLPADLIDHGDAVGGVR
ncbi:methyltransferase [uncultured Corynebacterium sp.]|uniref:DUF7782 domain-containing protein n=1 Tax=uncultured Corynebacterium sp. TaxID=159447 RepID=UPI0025EE8C76|nr:methyltransferase [uncultured Corynebacterium sp.]